MNWKLFYDLYAIVTVKSPEFQISKEEFLLFLLGDYSHENTIFSSDEISRCLKEGESQSPRSLKSLLISKYSKAMKYISRITLDNLIELVYSKGNTSKVKQSILSKDKEICSLYFHYKISMPERQDTEHLLLELFHICVIEKQMQLFASYKSQKIKPSTISLTFGRDDNAKNLKENLSEHPKIILTGQHGSGKTRFVSYCVNNWNLPDYCYICYTNNLKTTLHKIRYQDSLGNEYTNASSYGLYNNQVDTPPLLIIDNMQLSSNISDDLEQLSKMTVDIIVIAITAPEESSGLFYTYELPTLSNDELYQIFNAASGITIENNEQQNELADIAIHNPLLISLIAEQCKRYITSNPDITIDQILGKVKNTTKKDSFFTNKFKHQYDNASLGLLGHVNNIYNILINENKDSQTLNLYMKWICPFGFSPIPLKFLETVFPSYCESHLRTLSDMKLFELTEESVMVSPLIAYVIMNAKIPTLSDYKLLIKHLSFFLQTYDQTLDVPYLSDILFTFVRTLYDVIPKQNNPNQKKTSKYFEKWQELVYLTINYYNQNGAPELAQIVTEQIKYPDLLISPRTKADKYLFEISNRMRANTERAEILSAIDSTINQLPNILVPNFTIYRDTLTVTSLDRAVNMVMQLSLISNNCNTDYIKKCLLIIKTLTPHLYSKDNIINLDKIAFYDYVYKISSIRDPSCFDFDSIWDSFVNWQNTDYRMRGYATTIYAQSAFLYYECRSELYDTKILPKVQMLDNLIQSCKIIPESLFHICLYAYINALILQQVAISTGHLTSNSSINFFQQLISNLFSRSNREKESLDAALKALKRIEDVYK